MNYVYGLQIHKLYDCFILLTTDIYVLPILQFICPAVSINEIKAIIKVESSNKRSVIPIKANALKVIAEKIKQVCGLVEPVVIPFPLERKNFKMKDYVQKGRICDSDNSFLNRFTEHVMNPDSFSEPQVRECLQSVCKYVEVFTSDSAGLARKSQMMTRQKLAEKDSFGNELPEMEPIDNVQGIIKWEDSNHLMLLFQNKDKETISALYKDLQRVPKFITKLLEIQGQKQLRDLDDMSQTEQQNLVFAIARSGQSPIDPDIAERLAKSYVLTTDNILKMVLIWLRIQARIPVIVMGETGCGKTSLIRYLSKTCKSNLEVFNVHAGIDDKKITPGLQGKLKSDKLSHLVYRVHPIPEALIEYIWDFGSLSATDERQYIKRIVQNNDKILTDRTQDLFVALISESQCFVRNEEKSSYCVSLRDVNRCQRLYQWFMCTYFELKNSSCDSYCQSIKAMILSLAHCYYCRFQFMEGSESSTSDGIIKVFERAKEIQSSENILPLVILDEIGLAEVSQFNPLKVLHSLLEPVDRDTLDVAVVGISNWALDAAKMNRAIHLCRPDMDYADVYKTGLSIVESFTSNVIDNDIDEFETARPVLSDSKKRCLEAIAKAYTEYIQRQSFQNFHGLRDFYSLIKLVT
ncbi:hypothetical protein KUTeg_002556 [Tegillarca granosa]|uniref:AAA+ ATPase domain-containing protein n=1 Tax=Tegillarca granosa TaxID=220873 RepID=A0ABQ9FUR8_TEGGR|nr:hypothetical protein KUTeg_002556 [Tegillarca granosa]